VQVFNLASYFYAGIREAEEEANRVHDAVIAVVTNIQDPRKLARVRLTYPSLGMRDESDWTPVVMPGAGKDRGWFMLPEVGDEVLVMFEHGDLDRPVVIGALWNGKDAPPDQNDGKNERHAFVSKNGSKVVLDDDKKTVTLEDGGGHGKITFTEQAVTIEAQTGDTCFQAGADLDIVAGKITFSAGEVQFVAGGGGIKASAENITVKGSVVNVMGSQVDFHPGGVPKADKASGTVTEVDDAHGKGGGSGGGSSQPPPSSNQPPSGPTQPAPPPPPVDPGKENVPDQHSIEIAVLDALDRPAAGVFYKLVLPDGGTRTGSTDVDGKIRVSNIEKAGDCELTFPDVDAQGEPPA
jgi:phage baseplate assembly protein gpV